jgi:hypothetical protein
MTVLFFLYKAKKGVMKMRGKQIFEDVMVKIVHSYFLI